MQSFRELIYRLATEAQVELEGTELLPHDLWEGQHLPPLSWIERMSILLIGFDLTFNWENQAETVRLVPIEHPVAMVRHYPVTLAIRSIEKRRGELVPDARFKVVRQRMYVKGRLEDHERIDALLRGETGRKPSANPPREAVAGETRIARFAVQNKPLRPVLEQLARGLGMQARFDEQGAQDAGIALNQLVSVEIENATIDQAVAALLVDTGLAFEKRDRQILIRPAR